MRKISTIIPTYNAATYLREAIQTVLIQTYPSSEIIVVDDGSSDNTATVVKQFGARVNYFRLNHQGVAAARNFGVNQAQGEYLAFLDADDLWVANKLEQQIRVLQTAEPDMVFSHVEQFISPDIASQQVKKLHYQKGPMPGYLPASMLIKRKTFMRVGYFSTAWKVGEFIHWYSQAINLGLNSTLLPDVLLKRRLHTNNLGLRAKKSRLDYVRVVKAHLDLRRQNRTQ